MGPRRVALFLLLLGPGCVDDVTIGGDVDAQVRDASRPEASPRDAPPPPPIDTSPGCPDGEPLADGQCTPPSPLCSPDTPDGACASGEMCAKGVCVTPPVPCSPKDPTGTCPAGMNCAMGACVPVSKCDSAAPPDAGQCPTGELCAPTDECLPDPCAMMKCPDGPCCAIFEMGTYVPECTMGKPCP